MFADLFPIVQHAETVILRLQVDKQDPHKLQVFVAPQHGKGEKYPALNQTIMLSNTPEALDQEFAALFKAYVPEYVSASSSINDAVSQLTANTEAAKKAVTKTAAKTDTSKPTAASPKVIPKPAPAPSPQVNLFDDVAKADDQGEVESDGDFEGDLGASSSLETFEDLPTSPEGQAQPRIFEPAPIAALPDQTAAPIAIVPIPTVVPPPIAQAGVTPTAEPISLFAMI